MTTSVFFFLWTLFRLKVSSHNLSSSAVTDVLGNTAWIWKRIRSTAHFSKNGRSNSIRVPRAHSLTVGVLSLHSFWAGEKQCLGWRRPGDACRGSLQDMQSCSAKLQITYLRRTAWRLVRVWWDCLCDVWWEKGCKCQSDSPKKFRVYCFPIFADVKGSERRGGTLSGTTPHQVVIPKKKNKGWHFLSGSHLFRCCHPRNWTVCLKGMDLFRLPISLVQAETLSSTQMCKLKA